MTEFAPEAPRCPGLSVQDVLMADGDVECQPEAYRSQSSRFLGDADIPFTRFTDPDFFQAEVKRMWPRAWQWACREEHIPEAGDFYVYEVVGYSFIITRAEDGSIRAFYNACLHRGTKLKPSGAEGWAQDFTCPFHAWKWNLDGSLKDLPCSWDFPHVDKTKFALPEARTGTWGGFVFINMDPDAPSLEEWLAPLPEHADAAGLEDRYVALHAEKELPCNWKVAMEAFMESYHLVGTHPQLLVANGDINTQYDIYGDYVSRLFALTGITSPNYLGESDEQLILDSMVLGDRASLGDRLKVPDGGSARQVMARYFKDVLAESTGFDAENRSTTEIIDTLQYFAFPNGFFFLAVSFPIIYRFRPLGRDPNRSLFDLLILPPLPRSGERPPPAERHHLGVNDSYTTVPGMDEALGIVFDQDTGNMQAQQEGFLAAHKSGQTLANYQEVRIRHMHRTLDSFLAMPALKRG
ncbi:MULTISPECIES: SRPBCC family protein [unclassified Novosphingobium]|uniref:aromatic ring-hydroxylating oxygenase subunit alpha n=1 Tax=unclassified Novosphingobium TaxID=2644732 RepID=UPI00135A2B6C|nr:MULTISPECIES: aromatic ring-hydroxylating dioxygenase subunit alpha [unclassified Novosphingobium]